MLCVVGNAGALKRDSKVWGEFIRGLEQEGLVFSV